MNKIPCFDFNNIFLHARVSPAKLLLFYLIRNKGSSIVIISTNNFMILSENKFNFETHLQYVSQAVLSHDTTHETDGYCFTYYN